MDNVKKSEACAKMEMFIAIITVAIKIDWDLYIQYLVNFSNKPFINPDKKQNTTTPIH